jgi:16S rRNA (uracil1498-N3)-methyltransferase
MATFFAPEISTDSMDYLLSEEESKHCIRVLRYSIGSGVDLIDGKGNHFEAIISDNHPKRCKLLIKKVVSIPKPEKLVHIAMAPTKNMDRVEWFVEKAVELGLTKLTFLKCENNERNTINYERLHKITISAMKQSKRFYLPEIQEFISFKEFVEANPNGYFGHCYEGKKIKLMQINESRPFLIGPEGDFTTAEVDFAINKGYFAVNLSENRLRTETAALTAVFALVTS